MAAKAHAKSNLLVSIIIPVYRDWGALSLCLQALQKQTYSASLFEIIIVNNDEQSAIADYSLPSNAIVINEFKPGSYAARNAGLQQARGDLIGFTDADCIPSPQWIERAVQFAQNTQLTEFRITGPVEIFRKSEGGFWAWKFESIVSFNQKENWRKGLSVTANLFVNKAAFAKVGGFDSTLFSGGDMAWNALATRNKIHLHFDDNLVVQHPARTSFGEIYSKYRRVFGGGFVQAKIKKKHIAYSFRHFIPPLRYCFKLYRDDRPLLDILLAFSILWAIKCSMLIEMIRLARGAKPKRT